MDSSDDTAASGPGSALYVVSSGLRQRLDLIHHLVEFGRQIIVVSGQPGSGRSRFLEAVAKEAQARWLVIRVAGEAIKSVDQLLSALLDGLAGDLREDTDTPQILEVQVREQLNRLHSQGQLALLIADDCDRWNETTNELLFRLADTERNDGELRIIASCSSDSNCLQQLHAIAPQAAPLHLVETPPLEPDEIRSLAIALAERDGRPAPNLTSAELDQLHSRSGGNAADIIDLLTGPGPSPDPQMATISRALPDQFRRTIGIAITLAVAALLTALVLMERGNRPPESTRVEISLPAHDSIATAQPARDGETVISPPDSEMGKLDDAAVAPPGLAPEAPAKAFEQLGAGAAVRPAPMRPIESGPPPIAPLDDGLTADISILPPAQGELPAPLPPRDAGVPEVVPIETTDHRGEPISTASPSEAPSATPLTTLRYTPEWVLTHDDKSYVIQLFGVRERGSAERFIATNSLSEKATIFDLKHEGAAWHVVVLGLYPDREHAIQAINALTESLQGTGPWARPVRSLRE